mmetsp:Transcript_6075/g.15408  ORF Transcript_6075/g.15408 Transcript_6075/m.15408 type:complete len:161 (-) Transcript_6075:52-534(-)
MHTDDIYLGNRLQLYAYLDLTAEWESGLRDRIGRAFHPEMYEFLKDPLRATRLPHSIDLDNALGGDKEAARLPWDRIRELCTQENRRVTVILSHNHLTQLPEGLSVLGAAWIKELWLTDNPLHNGKEGTLKSVYRNSVARPDLSQLFERYFGSATKAARP